MALSNHQQALPLRQRIRNPLHESCLNQGQPVAYSREPLAAVLLLGAGARCLSCFRMMRTSTRAPRRSRASSPMASGFLNFGAPSGAALGLCVPACSGQSTHRSGGRRVH